jgi:hypothetical protein
VGTVCTMKGVVIPPEPEPKACSKHPVVPEFGCLECIETTRSGWTCSLCGRYQPKEYDEWGFEKKQPKSNLCRKCEKRFGGGAIENREGDDV